MFGMPLRKGFSMKVRGVIPRRPDMEDIAVDLGITYRDVLFENGVLTVYNTSDECQEIIDDGALISMVAMALEIPADAISELTAVEEEPKTLDLSDLLEEED